MKHISRAFRLKCTCRDREKRWSDTRDLKSSTALWGLRLSDFSRRRWRFPERKTWRSASPCRSSKAGSLPSFRLPGGKWEARGGEWTQRAKTRPPKGGRYGDFIGGRRFRGWRAWRRKLRQLR